MLKKRWQRNLLAYGLLGAFFLIWIWESWLGHTSGDICSQNPYTHQKECAPHNIVLVVLWQIGELLKDYGVIITAVATAFIAWFTFTLRQSTDKLAEIARQQTKLIGAQADILLKQKEIARLQFFATSGPRLIIRLVQAGFPTAGSMTTASVTIANVGKSEATVLGIGADIAQRKRNNWLPPGLDASPISIPADRTIRRGERKTYTVVGVTVIDKTDIRNIKLGVQQLCLVGEIRYSDDVGAVRHTGFFRVWDTERDRYVKADEPEYEYED